MATAFSVGAGEVKTVTLKGSYSGLSAGSQWYLTRRVGSNKVPMATFIAPNGFTGNGDMEITANFPEGNYTIAADSGHSKVRLTGVASGEYTFNDFAIANA